MSDLAVAAQVNPNAGLDTIQKYIGLQSSQLGVQKQKQDLQTGQYSQQFEQARASQEAQKAKEFQAGAQLLSDPVGNGILNADGSPTENSLAIVQRAMPMTGAGHYKNLIEGGKTKLEYTAASNSLTQGERAQLIGAASGVAADKAGKPEDAIANMQGVVDSMSGSPDQKHYATMADALQKMISSANKEDGTGTKWRTSILQAERGNLTPEGTVGAGGVATPGMGTNALGLPTVTDRVSGTTGSAPLAPGYVPPTAPQVAGQTSAATGQVQNDNALFGKVMEGSAKSQSGIALADKVAELSDEVRTGKLSKEWADNLAVLKQKDPQITARQMLSKYAAQLKTLAESGASTDAERSQIDAGMPSPESMEPGAVKEASQYLHGYFKMSQARGANATQHVSSTGSTQGLTLKDNSFMQGADPFVYSFKDMKREDQKEFLLKKFGPGHSKALDDFESRVNQAK